MCDIVLLFPLLVLGGLGGGGRLGWRGLKDRG